LLRNYGEEVGGNDWQNEVYLKLQAGTTSNHRRYIQWLDYAGNSTWILGANADNVRVLYDGVDLLHRFWFETLVDPYYYTGNSYITGAGTGGVVIGKDGPNGSPATGTGGLSVYSGGAPPNNVLVFNVAGSNGTITATGGMSIGTNGTFAVDFFGNVTANSVTANTGTFTQQTTNTAVIGTYWTNLVAPPNGSYSLAYCLDVVTSKGLGTWVSWNGTAWVTTEGVVATTSLTNFIVNAVAAGLNSVSSVGCYSFTPYPWLIGSQNRNTVVSGSGTGISPNSGESTYGSDVYYDMGTTASGYARSYGPNFVTATGPNLASTGGGYASSTAPNGTDNYWVFVGMAVSSTSFPTTGAGFIYDPYLANSIVSNATMSAHWTNNWIAISVNGGTYSYMDTGLPFSTTLSSPARILGVLSTNSFTAFTNGGWCGVITSNVCSLAQVYVGITKAQKTLGTTDIRVIESTPSYSMRHAANSYP